MSDEFINCPHWGKGGRYIVDKDGNRQPVVEAPEPVVIAAPDVALNTDPAAVPAADSATTKKGNRNG